MKRDIGDYIVQQPLLIPMHPQLPIHTPMVDCHVSAIILYESVVPREATSFHRFHLASERRALSLSDTVVLPVRPLVGSSVAVTYCIVGYAKSPSFVQQQQQQQQQFTMNAKVMTMEMLVMIMPPVLV